ncbi:MAG: hypothetical protein F6K63_13665 [Moorea sp. SIO1G6]|uniref:hypothetical protein n=1 Tax=Moorena sp. SIO1G6 TaxID=2607840 RepID=UPI0013C2821C|nr:hypothetical protein [Moorena sp. SIO1G6]NET65368.1 hypothetical protein [Moorena sp. SIO1G6]
MANLIRLRKAHRGNRESGIGNRNPPLTPPRRGTGIGNRESGIGNRCVTIYQKIVDISKN